MNERDRKKIIESAERDIAAWSDPAFGSRLDTSSMLMSTPNFDGAESSFEEQAEGLHIDMSGFGGRKSPLKKWLRSIETGTITDAEAEFLAKETNDPRLVVDHLDRKAGAVSQAFVDAHPEYAVWDGNFKLMVAALCEQADIPCEVEEKHDRDRTVLQLIRAGYWTLENLNAAYAALQASGQIDYDDDYVRPLSETQKARIKAELAMGGDEQQALLDYLSYSIGIHPIHFEREILKKYKSVARFLSENQALTQQAASFIFYVTTPGFEPTADRLEFLRQFCGSRFVTVALLRQGWGELQKLEQQQATYEERRSLLFAHDENEPAPVSEAQLEDMNDQQIHDLYSRTARHIAKTTKRAPGLYQ